MTSENKAGAVAVTLTFLLAIAVFGDALLASAAWQPSPASRAPVPARVAAPSPSPSPSPAPSPRRQPPPTDTRIVHVRTGTVETTHITREAARRAVRSAIPDLERCYRQARAMRPDLEGRIVIHVAITHGGVETRMMTTTTGDDRPLEQCIVDMLARGDWPDRFAEVVVPLILDTTAD